MTFVSRLARSLPAELISDLWHMVFPALCIACGNPIPRHGDILCLQCRSDLPQTDYVRFRDNPVAKKFWGRVPVEHACAMYHFRKSARIQQVLHLLKYRGRRDAGICLGRLLGWYLKDHEPFTYVHCIVPVPLHRSKEQKRGYNQSAVIAEGMSEVMHVPAECRLLLRTHNTESQTHKGRIERWKNVRETFCVRDPAAIKGRRILLIDDVITTGATLEACALRLLEAGAAGICIAAVAHAEM